MNEAPDQKTGMQSVLRSLEVLEAVSQSQPVGISVLARTLDIPKTTVHRIVRTLAEAGWVSPLGVPGEQRWVLTARALAVGARVADQEDLRTRARSVMVGLGAKTDENIHLSVPDGDALVLIEKIASSRPVQTVSAVGERAPAALTASGWAFLSRLPEREARALVPEVVTLADGTKISVDDLMIELRTVAANGYAVNPGRWRPDVSAVGAAIEDRVGRPIAALSISMPTYRLTDELIAPYGELVRTAAGEISEGLTRR